MNDDQLLPAKPGFTLVYQYDEYGFPIGRWEQEAPPKVTHPVPQILTDWYKNTMIELTKEINK